MAKNILSKILIFCTLFVLVLLLGPQIVRADGMETYHEYRVEVLADTSFIVEHKVKIVNKNEIRLLRKYALEIPFEDVSLINVSEKNRPANYKYQNNTIQVNLRRAPLRFRQRTELVFRYQVYNQIPSENGLLSLYIPKLRGREDFQSYQTIISYPDNFPSLVFHPTKSTVSLENGLIVNELTAIKLVWGSEWGVVISDSGGQISNRQDGARRLINVVPNIFGQKVKFNYLSVPELFTEDNGNLWANAAEKFSYTAYVSKTPVYEQPEDFINYSYRNIAPPVMLQDSIELKENKYEAVKQVYEYMVQNFRVNYSDLNSAQELSVLERKLANYQQETMNSLEYAIALAGYLQSMDVEHRLVYGYFYGVTWPRFNEKLPHIWVEAKVNGELLRLDPFMEALTGLEFFDTPDVGRIAFGIWDPELSADNLLGLLGPGLKIRPDSTPAEVLGVSDTISNRNVEVKIKHPKSTASGEGYNVNLEISNGSAEILELGAIYWDEVDLTETIAKINERLSLAIGPQQTLELEIRDLVWPHIFYDGKVEHKFVVIPANSEFDPVVQSYEMLYVPGNKVLIGIGAMLLLGIILLLSVLRRWGYKERLILNDLPYD